MPLPVHAYPPDLARVVRERWVETASSEQEASARDESGLPSSEVLQRLLSVCFQASLLHEERRPVTFRICFAEPERIAIAGGPPAHLLRLSFERSRPFDEHELRRLAPAAVFDRSLIGVHVDSGELRVWGLINSGPRWLQAVRGGRRIVQSIPPVLMVAATGPGRVLVSKGHRTLAALAGGTLANVATDVFSAPWFASVFERTVPEQRAAHSIAPQPESAFQHGFREKLSEHVLRRIVATIRAAGHGGTLVILPPSAQRHCKDCRCLTIKYPFLQDEPRWRIATLIHRIMTELAAERVSSGTAPPERFGWTDYEASASSLLNALDEALYEVAHLVAMLANVDGAVVLTAELEMLGFGGEISGSLPEVAEVERCLDVDGQRRISERTDRVGTRHRSAYRLCQRVHGALVIVVSQDGGVRFVCFRNGAVVYFDQIATGPWEV